MHAVKPDQPVVYADAKAILRQQAQLLWDMLEIYELPKEKMQSIGDFAIGMKAKHWDMSNERIVRKTVEYYKLRKLTPEEYQALKTAATGSSTENHGKSN